MTAVVEPTAAVFNPADHLMRVQGGVAYLEVKWRLVWFRKENPNGMISTTIERIDDETAIFKATVVNERGGSATGHGSETAGDFRDYAEKAETKAIGRALAALGYGTQFCEDFGDTTPEGVRVVDAPVRNGHAQPATVASAPSGGAITERQMALVNKLAGNSKPERDALQRLASEIAGRHLEHLNELTTREGSALIDRLKPQGGRG